MKITSPDRIVNTATAFSGADRPPALPSWSNLLRGTIIHDQRPLHVTAAMCFLLYALILEYIYYLYPARCHCDKSFAASDADVAACQQ